MSRPWLPVSASEWMASASSDAAPVSANAMNLLSAMPRFARNAAMIVRFECWSTRRCPTAGARPSSDDAALRHRLDVERPVQLGVGHELPGPHDRTDRFPRTRRLLDDLGRGLVAD